MSDYDKMLKLSTYLRQQQINSAKMQGGRLKRKTTTSNPWLNYLKQYRVKYWPTYRDRGMQYPNFVKMVAKKYNQM